ncbi:MAG: hypothetical protein COC08_06700, partial [Maribacter sp.]
MKIAKEDLFEGIKKSLKNADELFEDAQILKNNKRISRAYTLFQFCIEECGKASLIYSFLLDDDIENSLKLKKFRAKYRNHISKTSASQGFDLIFALLMKDNKVLQKKIITNSFIQ